MSHIAEHNYHAKQGDTFSSVITLEDKNGSAIDLTGAEGEIDANNVGGSSANVTVVLYGWAESE